MTRMPIRPDDEELTIKTGGKTLGGWLSLRVMRGVERLPSGFMCQLTERYPGQAAQVAVEPGATCQVFLGSDLIITGYIDKYQPAYSGTAHTVMLMGRSKTEDVVDSSVDTEALSEATGGTWEVKAGTIGDAAKLLCKPLHIDVSLPDGDVPLEPTYPFIVNPGMTVYQLLEEMARSVQVLMWDDPQGRLVLSKVGTKRAATPLVEGINVEIAAAQYSMDQRYHEIRVLGQVGQLSPTRPGIHENYFGSALDPDVRDGRLLVMIMDQVGIDGAWPQKRANWEIGRRYGRSRQIQVTVTGWRGSDGQLWTPNTIVSVKCPTLKMNQDLVISEAAWMRSEQGTQTVLTLMPAKGLMPAPFLFTAAIPALAGGATSA